MTNPSSRREFINRVGRGMILASVGSAVATDLGLFDVRAADAPAELTFGQLEPLVDFLHATPADQMLPEVAQRIRQGTPLQDIVAAAALANARAFGGEDYVGFHTLMALSPALTLSKHMRDGSNGLPILKVLYRNSTRLQQTGGGDHHTLRPISVAAPLTESADTGSELRQMVRSGNLAGAETTLAGLVAKSSDQAFNAMLAAIEDATEVHRVVLMHRAWDMLSIVGREQAGIMLRQSLHYCVKNEAATVNNYGAIRSLLPKLIDQFHLEGRSVGTKVGDDAWLNELVETLWTASPDQAAEAVAASLVEGFAPAAIAEAVSLCANQLVLRDAGRTGAQIQPGKPAGSVHGDSIGVHACDSANAWRSLARQAEPRHALTATILAGYQVAMDRVARGGQFQAWAPRPHVQDLEAITETSKCHLIGDLASAIRSNDQAQACAVTQQYLNQDHSVTNLWSMFAMFATSEDGALHAEKFFRTCREEYELTRPAFRNRQVIALARVSASQFGNPAPGFEEAKRLLQQ